MEDTKSCETCSHYTDTENFSNKQSLGFRLSITIIAWLVLGVNIPVGTFYFSSIFLFVCPLALDYLKYIPKTSDGRKLLRSTAIVICVFFIIFSICGFVFMNIENIDGISYIVISNDFLILSNFKFKVVNLWISLISLPILTIIDFFAHTTPGEINNLNFQLDQTR